MIRLLLTTLVTLAALLVPVDPAAGETRHPEVRWPLAAPVIRVDNRTNGGWKIRAVLREIERRTVVDVRKGRCRHIPTEVCVTVREGHWTPREQRRLGDLGYEWVGLAVLPHDPGARRLIYLNNRYRSLVLPRQVTAHEFGHVLGLDHHRRKWGALGTMGRPHFSKVEVRAVNRAYQK